ncbi:MAG TPA: hypothetical protein PLB05_01640 [Candidatus Omnitrophota bacterium]|jgi:hypothetical protein|nr:hypothetical protein [Candidatus Omnitrophota bacterium]HPN57039.1 hypothetical protein [Candidatus Omnitrophota bacterium]
MQTNRQNFRLILWIGIIFFPVFFILDCFIYADHKWALFSIRAAIVMFLSVMLVVVNRVRDKVAVGLINVSFVIAAFSISFMCYITGEGARSPYYAGLFLIIIAISALINMAPGHYLYVISFILGQHFLLISLAPFDLRGILSNIFFLGSFCAIGILLHSYNYRILNEIKKLRGFLPICAKCKKIRDDKGYWNQIERYIQERSDAVFSHGLCPDCAQEYFNEIEAMESQQPGSRKDHDKD